MEDIGTFLRQERHAAGLTLRELAERAETSVPTLSDYERGRREPRLSTIDRLLRVLGRRLTITSAPVSGDRPLTVKDRQSLALHLRVAERFLAEPDQVRESARRNLERLYPIHRSGHSDDYLDTWRRLLDGSPNDLLDALTSTEQRARDLRQASPFAGVLPPDERELVLESIGT
jgi:transcriptional regulator with XRE-family HTH domain